MYRVADQTARVRDLEEEIARLQSHIEDDAEADAERERELRAAKKELRVIRTHRLFMAAGVVTAVAGCCVVIFFVAKAVASMPDHEHVEWNGQAAMQNDCSSSEEARSNAYCRDEAIAECRGQSKVKELESNETFHPAYTTTTMSCNDKGVCTPIITHHPARYTYVYTYQCKVGPK